MAAFTSHCSEELVADEFLLNLIDHIVDQWRAVGRHLRLPPGTVTVLETNHAGDLKEVIYQMLLSWKQDAGLGATYGTLAAALHKAHRKDLAQLVCKGKLPDDAKSNAANTVPQSDFLNKLKKDLKWFYLNSLCKIPMSPWGGEKVSIESIFTNIELLQRTSNPQEPQHHIPLDSIHELFPSKHQKDQRTRSILQGKAGSGKSTTVAKLAFEWASGEMDPDSPVRSYDLLFVLKMRAMKSNVNLGDAIISQLLSADSGYTSDGVEKFIKDHEEKIAIIFDGFDEYPSPVKGQLVGNITDILRGKRLRHCCILITMRPWKVLESKDLADYIVYEVKGFSPENVDNYIMEKSFRQQPEMGRKLLKYLELSNLKDSVACIPLLTSLMCHLWKADSNIMDEPPKRLGELFECLCSCFDSQSVTDDNPISTSSDEEGEDKTDGNDLIEALGPIALDGLFADHPELVFSHTYLKGNLEKGVLKEIKRTGLLTFEEKRRPSVKRRTVKGRKTMEKFVSFYHKVIQEYCAGLQLAILRENEDTSFEVYIKKIQSVARALDLSYVLLFASWKSQKAAEDILNLLLNIFNEMLKFKVSDYENGSLPLQECQMMQKYYELCLQLNYEADSKGKLNPYLSSIFCSDAVRLVGISSYVSEALGHYLKYLSVESCSNSCASEKTLKSLQLMQLNFQSTTAFREVRKQFPSAEQMHIKNMNFYARQTSAQLEQLKCSLTTKEKTTLTGMENWNSYEFVAKYQLCQLFRKWQCSRISLQSILKYLVHLRLEKLILTGQNLSDSLPLLKEALISKSLSKLQHLSLSHCELTENESEELAPFMENLTSLRELDLSNNRLGYSFGEHLPKLANLTTLILEKTIDKTKVMEKFAEAFQSLPKLTCLEFRRNEITETGILKISTSLNLLHNLQAVHLPLQNLPSEVFPNLVEALSKHKNLRDIQLLHTSWPTELCRKVAAIVPGLSKLEDLRVSGERAQTDYPTITEEDVMDLINALCKLKNLKMFSILHVKMDISLLEKMVELFANCESSHFGTLRITKKLVIQHDSLHMFSEIKFLLLW